MEELFKRMDKVMLFLIIYTFIFILFFKTLGYTLPFVLALIFALLLQKPTKFLVNKFKMKNFLASMITTVIFFAFIILLVTIGITSLTSELIQLGKNTQAYISNNTPLINLYAGKLREYYDRLDPTLVLTIQNNLSNSISKISNLAAAAVGGVATAALSFLASVPYIIMVVLFTLLSTYFFTKDLTSAKDKVLNFLPSENTGKMVYIFNESKKMLSGYALSYAFIIFITFLETLVGFSILRVKYAVILSIISAIVDVMPVLGVGSVYVPLAILHFISGNYVTGIGILILYALVFIIRQIIEPKILSSSLGLHPVAVLAAIFIGLKANGVAGMFFCMFLVVFYTIFKKVKLL